VDPHPDIPPAALAFLLMPEAARLDDTVWWETWRDPRWKSRDYHLTISEQECPVLRPEGLEQRLDCGVDELLQAVDGDRLGEFYSLLLSGPGPAVLRIAAPALSPLALAALLLPLERELTEEISVAGGVFSGRLDPAALGHWRAVVVPPRTAAVN